MRVSKEDTNKSCYNKYQYIKRFCGRIKRRKQFKLIIIDSKIDEVAVTSMTAQDSNTKYFL